MLPTTVAPTSTSTHGPLAESNTHTTRSLRANRPGTPRAVVGLTENKSPGTRHVDAVIIARAQIQRGKVAIVKLRCQHRVARQQRGTAVLMAFGLENLLALNTAKLADGTIHRANQVSLGQRAGTVFEGSSEEVVEAGVAGHIRIGSLGHVDLVAPHKPFDQPGRQAPATGLRNLPRQSGERLLGQQILRQHGKAVKHWSDPSGNGRNCTERFSAARV